MEKEIIEAAQRIKALREILEISIKDMADYLDISIQEYMDLEDAKVDFSFTCLHKCAQKFGVDITDLVIGENPRLSFFDVTKKDKGSIIIKRNGFKYKQIGAMLKDKLMESFIVDAPYDVKLLNQPISVSTHQGQELTFILEGSLKVQIENHTVILNEGDSVVFDTEYPHGMIAVSENGCRFLAVMTNSI